MKLYVFGKESADCLEEEDYSSGNENSSSPESINSAEESKETLLLSDWLSEKTIVSIKPNDTLSWTNTTDKPAEFLVLVPIKSEESLLAKIKVDVTISNTYYYLLKSIGLRFVKE